jgi:hypothetical protein
VTLRDYRGVNLSRKDGYTLGQRVAAVRSGCAAILNGSLCGDSSRVERFLHRLVPRLPICENGRLSPFVPQQKSIWSKPASGSSRKKRP